MKNRLIALEVRGRTFLRRELERFLSEERGASHMVEIIVVIVIVIAVAATFQQQLGGAIRAIFDKLTTFIGQ